MRTYNDVIPVLQKLSEADVTRWGYALYDIIGKRLNTEAHSYTHIIAIMATPEEMWAAYLKIKK